MFEGLPKRKLLLLTGDILLLYLSLFLTLFLRSWGQPNWITFKEHLLPFTILYFIWLIVFYIFGFYDLYLSRKTFSLVGRVLAALAFCLILGTVFFYFIPLFGITPKTNLLLNIFISGFLIIAWRKIFYSLFSLRFQVKTAVLGENPQSKEFVELIRINPQLGYKFVGFLSREENIPEKIREKQIDTLILAENFGADSPLAQILYQCVPFKLNFLDLADAYEIIAEKIPISFINQIWFLKNIRERRKNFYEIAKRIIEIFLASFFLILTLPLWLIIALLIYLEDKGPIFYKQKRIGKDRKPFLLIKFRTMKPDAETAGPIWASPNDQRMTKIGRLLRRTHLDELPQLINILKGDISLVGPRPERPEFVEQLEKEIPHYHLRHIIKPGFTGWAQIKFRYARSITDSFEKFQYDLYYLKNRSLFLDFKILLQTLQLLFRKE